MIFMNSISNSYEEACHPVRKWACARSWRQLGWLTLLLLVMSLLGCQSTPTRDPAFAPARPAVPVQRPGTQGAIYRNGNNLALFEDLRARRIGDLLTIRLSEQTAASKSAQTSTDRDSDNTINNPTIFGSTLRFNAPGVIPLASNRDNTLNSSLSSSSDFDGKGESKQSNSLEGEITVTVAEVYPNGNLFVRGEKLLTLNQGHEHVRFSGIVRPVDIASDNSVSSTKVADAQIIYAGEGAVAQSNVAGWLSKFFVSALFPF